MRHVFLVLFPVFLVSISFAFDGREQLINQQLSCLEQHMNDSGVDWSDLCYMGTRENHAMLVADALDVTEQTQVSQELNSTTKDGRDTKKYNTFEQVPPYVRQKLNPRHIHTFDVSEETYYYRYNEDIPIKISGFMIGYNLDYAFRPPDENSLNNFLTNTYMVQYRFATGKLDYKGSGTVEGERNDNWELRGLVGKDYLLGDKTLVTPYIGLGYRFLFDEGNDIQTSTGLWGYDRRSNYYYFPLGFTATLPDGDWTSIFNFEYDVFLGGRQYSDLSSVGPHVGFEYPNGNNHQGSGYGLRGSAKFMMKSKSWNFYVEPFARFWSIKQSSTFDAVISSSGVPVASIQLVEPKNDTMELGSKFGLQF